MLIIFIQAAKANESEPNNTPGQADVLALNGANNGKISTTCDIDWWKVTTTANGKLNITLSGVSTYVYVYLYDNDATTELEATYTASTVTISEDGLAPGTYYIKVNCYYPGDVSSYTLSNTLTVATPANDAEPNNTRAQAKVLPVSSTKTGHVGFY